MDAITSLPAAPITPSLYTCSIVIPLYNRVDLTAACLQSLAANTQGVDFEVVLVDNASSDATPDLCRSLGGDVVVIRNEENLGFSKACNQGALASSSDRILFLNNDTEAWPGWLPPMLADLGSADDIAAVGSKLLFPDGTIQHAGVVVVASDVEPPMFAMHLPYQEPPDHPLACMRRDVAVATGACLLVDRDRFFAVGGFDEGFWCGYEDVDLCLKFRAEGWRIRYEPESVLTHHESASGPERFRAENENTRRLQARWTGKVTPDLIMVGSEQRVNPDGCLAGIATTRSSPR
jgi:GT2 family glycosyltransferase